MCLSDELDKLDELHRRGVLTDDEFARAKARLFYTATPPRAQPPALAAALNRFRRSASDRWVGGICGGLAELTGMASWIWRLMLVLLALCGGTGVLAYLLMWIFVPLEGRHTPARPGEWHAG